MKSHHVNRCQKIKLVEESRSRVEDPDGVI